MLSNHAKKTGGFKPPTTTVPLTTAKLWSDLLMDRDYSDVTIECTSSDEDCGAPSAHKAILAGASDYYRTLFAGPWKDSHENKVLTNTSYPIMQAILTFIYTGQIGASLLDQEADALLDAATQVLCFLSVIL
jgi:hypothetical protein